MSFDVTDRATGDGRDGLLAEGSRREDVGFERIPDGRVVLELMRRMQGEKR
ncbi:hypothetical protein GCM10011534_21680 [Pseudooceanicola nanhaiensis]|jgi:hypothetical protein|uniref:Uncharacterized protein n=1 Tax=Pseudooceanicola nanhaiensis TaxID=375761 RepID=A0A917SUH1_9RHOB|nr:hypothetical protein [Pseudooceanicola nanhaiensis]GGL99498.1 hypothetical protein GCM10011534_21680 [Pseudooceanicola nanhaiensis]